MAGILQRPKKKGVPSAIPSQPKAIDPNMRDILFCVDTSVKDDQNQWRYTSDTRRKGMNVKINRKILERKKTTTMVEERSINDWEASGLPFNKKTMQFEKFMEYLKWKNSFNLKICQ